MELPQGREIERVEPGPAPALDARVRVLRAEERGVPELAECVSASELLGGPAHDLLMPVGSIDAVSHEPLEPHEQDVDVLVESVHPECGGLGTDPDSVLPAGGVELVHAAGLGARRERLGGEIGDAALLLGLVDRPDG